MIDDPTMLAIATLVAKLFEMGGIGVIVLGALYAAGAFATSLVARTPAGEDRVAALRRMLGRAILTGLELLVAADIIRTFLSFSLEVEIDGRWPWQKKPSADGGGGETASGS